MSANTKTTPVTVSRTVAKQMTGISWADFTANSWIGCTRVNANSGGRSGCDICYAASFAENRLGQSWGPGAPRRPVASFATRMRSLNKLAKATGMPFSVFSLSLGDWLDPEVDPAMRAGMLEVVEECTSLTWLLLTHRPHLIKRLLPSTWVDNLPAHVWPGVTVDHPAHGYRWRQLADVWEGTGRAWVSAEPLAASLATVDLTGACVTIYGGASGTNDPSWEFRREWVDEAVARYGEERVYFKQYGDFKDGVRLGKKEAGRELDGRIYDHTPWARHREILEAVAAQPTSAERVAEMTRGAG